MIEVCCGDALEAYIGSAAGFADSFDISTQPHLFW
jgi:hypothetical protein